MIPISQALDSTKRQWRIPTVSATLRDGALVELVYDRERNTTGFIVAYDGEWRREQMVALDETHRLVPYSPNNNLIRNGVVLLPSEPEPYGTPEILVQSIQTFLHRYVDVSPLFETLAAYYVLLSWLYDSFQELPYLRLRGDPGSGKTRFLLTVGSLCYKPIFASGASTVSPLFRLLDIFRGTLIIDEGDFRFSDERAEIVKILNNGNARGFPVLRSEVSGKGEFNPKAYHVFGPKLVATRSYFEDRALESRCLTEEMGHHRLRDDIPINLPPTLQEAALHLRNQLLFFRFKNLGKYQPSEALVDRSIEPRLNQIFVPLLAVIDDPTTRNEIRGVARRYDRDSLAERSMDPEAQVVEIISELASSPDVPRVSVKEITELFIARHGEDYERKITPKWIGTLIRRRLNLKPVKREGLSVLPVPELAKLAHLRERYGLSANAHEPVAVGGVGAVEATSPAENGASAEQGN